MSEMKKILIFTIFCILCTTGAGATVRDGTNPSRKGTNGRNSVTSQRVISTKNTGRGVSSRTTILNSSQRNTKTANTDTSTRDTTTSVVQAHNRTPVTKATQRSDLPNARVIARASDTPTLSESDTPAATSAETSVTSETRTGAQYEKCKSAYFTCMDQFCQLKNDTYRRCSCSSRIYKLSDAMDTLQQAGEQLTTFTENLDTVGMTAAQVTAMRQASEGESALTADTSASKALLQAIMNSIRGESTSVGGKYTDLNSVNLSFDTTNAFGITDSGQTIATYNGQNLYSAVYPSCRQAVKGDCNDASLQRAINAYLMAIEQDCNTVQTAIENKQKQVKSAIREGSAMLDLARVENRQKHNSSDLTTCINDIENSILSEEVCGENYHKCLDNGEYIDIDTGKPITGVEQFYKLAEMLNFSSDVDAAHQKLSKNINNRSFVNSFENRTKKFAANALDKCVEIADEAWSEYLDRAMLAIYYAQQSKVDEIKQECFNFISQCYNDVGTGLSAAIQDLSSDGTIVLQPDLVTLTSQMCQDYIKSCDNMFDNNIIAEYVSNQKDTDTKSACRAVAKQCFDKFGGSGFQNFYYPYSGIFSNDDALDWFTLYDQTTGTQTLKSECAKQLAQIDSCKSTLESVFGGFDKYNKAEDKASIPCEYCGNYIYGTKKGTDETLYNRHPRSTGVATEIYHQIVDILSTQCMNMQGKFVEIQNLPSNVYNSDIICQISEYINNSTYANLIESYYYYYDDGNKKILEASNNVCPKDYALSVSTKSWGACLCWENGARHSNNGTLTKCTAPLNNNSEQNQTTLNYNAILDQYCPGAIDSNTAKCDGATNVPEGINKNTSNSSTSDQTQ